ncbi:magnesium transporter [Natrinema hispanicum]|uniref:MgtE-like transporter n=1 Tax=Natrinema hispanicum TaxID=392421 RepID=A0A1G6R633_9EURY|nr:magnesium transporter [Natrinema hispanicum]SDC99998.1 mgtE-like transporter [Natrinema hispanicum]SET71611.1 mgtE-like transporter [Natrinema hispanicum]
MEGRQSAWRIYRESLPILVVSLAGGIFAGSVLGSEGMTEGFERFPGMLLLLPAFLATRGNVYGALGARISSGLHQGMIDPEFSWDRRLVNAVAASFINGIGVSVFIAVLSWGILQVLGRESARLIELISIMVVSGVFTSTTLIFGLLTLVFASYEYGLDPDNLIGPIVTTLGDFFGVVFLFIALTVAEVIF